MNELTYVTSSTHFFIFLNKNVRTEKQEDEEVGELQYACMCYDTDNRITGIQYPMIAKIGQ